MLVDLRDNTPKQLLEKVCYPSPRLHHFPVINDAFDHSCSKIRDTRDAKHLHSLMTSGDGFRNRRHPHSIGTKRSKEPDLRGCFISRARESAVNSSVEEISLNRINAV